MIKGCIASFATHPLSLFLKLLLMILQGIELVVAAMLQKQLLVRYSKSDYEHRLAEMKLKRALNRINISQMK